jgi:kanamycin kinase
MNAGVIAESPQQPVEVPQIVTELAAGQPLRAVWRNVLGGLTPDQERIAYYRLLWALT